MWRDMRDCDAPSSRISSQTQSSRLPCSNPNARLRVGSASATSAISRAVFGISILTCRNMLLDAYAHLDIHQAERALCTLGNHPYAEPLTAGVGWWLPEPPCDRRQAVPRAAAETTVCGNAIERGTSRSSIRRSRGWRHVPHARMLTPEIIPVENGVPNWATDLSQGIRGSQTNAAHLPPVGTRRLAGVWPAMNVAIWSKALPSLGMKRPPRAGIGGLRASPASTGLAIVAASGADRQVCRHGRRRLRAGCKGSSEMSAAAAGLTAAFKSRLQVQAHGSATRGRAPRTPGCSRRGEPELAIACADCVCRSGNVAGPTIATGYDWNAVAWPPSLLASLICDRMGGNSAGHVPETGAAGTMAADVQARALWPTGRAACARASRWRAARLWRGRGRQASRPAGPCLRPWRHLHAR